MEKGRGIEEEEMKEWGGEGEILRVVGSEENIWRRRGRVGGSPTTTQKIKGSGWRRAVCTN
jgi:hypothetical protein